MSQFIAIISISLVLFGGRFASAGPNEEELAIQQIAVKLSALPEDPHELGMRHYYRNTMERLVEKILNLADKNARYYSVFKPLLEVPRTAMRFKEHAALYESLLQDWRAMGDEIETYKMPTFVDPKNEMIPVPEVYLLRIRIAEQFQSLLTMRLFFETLENVVKGKNGVEKLVANSPRAHSWISGFPDSLKSVYLGIYDDLVKLSSQARRLSVGGDVSFIKEELKRIDDSRGRLDILVQFAGKQIYEILPRMREIRQKPFTTWEELEKSVTELGKGLATTARVTQSLRPRVTTHFHAMEISSNAAYGDDPGTVLSNIERDFQFLFRGGGWYMTNLGLPSAMVDGDGSKGVQFYQSMQIFEYVLVAAAEIGRLTQSPEGKTSWTEGVQATLRIATSQIAGTRSQLPAVIRANGNLWQRSLPPQVQNRRAEMEDKLWKLFFASAGLSDMESCMGMVLPAPSN